MFNIALALVALAAVGVIVIPHDSLPPAFQAGFLGGLAVVAVRQLWRGSQPPTAAVPAKRRRWPPARIFHTAVGVAGLISTVALAAVRALPLWELAGLAIVSLFVILVVAPDKWGVKR